MNKGNNSSSSIIIAVDILPIRKINNNVITIIGDITTEATKAKIKSEMQGAAADVVLADGAPNVGASYDKDAYEQNEIALHCLKCATQHLKHNGSFITKLYRSQDYSSYLWVAKQFFMNVQAVKPAASRSQSAEIFLVCTGYRDPTSIDVRMFDPKFVFDQVDGAATGGGDAAQSIGANITSVGKMNIFHKKWGEKRRSRQGYDMTQLDASMRNIGSICDFMEGSANGRKECDPIHMLSVCTGISFSCSLCKEKKEEDKDEEESSKPECNCKFYLEHELTSSEVKACLSDLKVLNRSDFKGLLTWRLKMQDALKKKMAQYRKQEGIDDDDHEDEASSGEEDEEQDSDAEEEGIQTEIQEMRQRKLREKKKAKKKERELAAKRRRRAALGMDLNAVDVPDNDKIFSLATITSKGDLEAAREVDLSKVTDDQLDIKNDSDYDDDGINKSSDKKGVEGGENDEVESQGEEDEIDEETGYDYRLDRELDAAYDRYLSNTKDGMAKSGTKMAKRTKKLQRQKAMEEAREDEEMVHSDLKGINNDTKTYAKMLQGANDSDDDSDDEDAAESSDDDDDDGFHSAPLTPAEHTAKREAKRSAKQQDPGESKNPLIHELPDEPTSVKTARWFSNPLFESIEGAAQSASLTGFKDAIAGGADGDNDELDSDDEDEVQSMSSDDEDNPKSKKKKRRQKNANMKDEDDLQPSSITADDVLAMMPKTDKQIRHERRKKAMEREERKKSRRARQMGEIEGGFETAPAAVDDDDDDIQDNGRQLSGLSEQERKKVLDARALIKAGIGETSKGRETDGFEIVSALDAKKATNGRLLPIMDSRKYDSENEDYDSDDYAETLALGTMMLRQSKAKALVDASYNRFAWNDPHDLPDWFVDDENKHYRPQLPIPPELLAKMKAKFLSLSTKPIAKVAEARARKNKRARTKLAAAKKKAEAVANSSEMSEAMKLKAISKAMRGQDAKNPGKTYVVSKKGGGTKGGKGIKLVDKRMRNDKRSMERASKKRKGGKVGGLTGSKKRRNHK
mmetsp:Transcript_65605/g.97143  ORF Transcript_65605/g.97143 Transcript_65605/m.97143 type:complete len:1026 (+) Transcript_65605:290-3367(+)